MSYCVHCGVELDANAKSCPLCGTPVLDPSAAPVPQTPPPFPADPGVVGPASRSELALLLTSMFTSAALCCGILNLFFQRQRWWSLYVMGCMLMLWVWLVPPLLFRRMPLWVRLLLDAAAVGVYVGLIAVELDGLDWFMGLALPIILLGAALVTALGFLLREGRRSLLTSVTLIIGSVGLFLVGVECFVDRAREGALSLSWSLVVLTICIALVIPLVVVRRVPSLREEARKRFHL